MENPQVQHPQEESIDIRKFIFKVLRNWYWFVASIIVSFAIAWYINKYNDPVYSINASIIINEEKKSAAEMLINVLDRFSARKNVENEIAILRSYKMAYKAITDLPEFSISYFSVGRVRTPMLYKNTTFKVIVDTVSNNKTETKVFVTILNKEEFKLKFDGDDTAPKTHKFGVPYIDDNYNFTLFLSNPEISIPTEKDFYFVIRDIHTLTKEYQSKLVISTNDKKGTVLSLSTTGLVQEKEADYLNKLMEVYIQNGLEEKNQTAINTIAFIDEQLSTVVDSLRRAEDKLQNFRLSNKILDISSEGNAIMQRLEKVQNEKVNLEMQLRYYKYIQEYIEKRKDFREIVAPSVMGVNDPLLNSLVSELASLYGERATLNISAQQNFPGISQINAKIQNTLGALRENISQIISSTSLTLAQLQKRQQDVEREIQRLPVTERHLLNIQRDFKLNDQIYNFLLQRRADAAISRASNVADNKILDIAKPQDALQISPKAARNKMIAIVLGILIPLSIIILIEFFNDKIMEPADIEKHTKLPIYGSIGHNEEMSDIPASEKPKSAIAESFRALRTNLQYVLRNKSEKIICISSTISGEGKTFTAVNLASIIAQSNKRTLLVGLDLRKPKVHKIFNIENDKGLSTFLIGRSAFEEVIHETNIPNLFIANSGPVPPNPAELLETQLMDAFLAEASQNFDIIILDTPPLAVVTDALILTRFSNLFLFVVRQNYSSKSVLNLIEDLHYKRGVQNVGVVINDVKISSYYGRKYGYSYSYGYNYSYGEGYYGEVFRKETFGSKFLRIFKDI